MLRKEKVLEIQKLLDSGLSKLEVATQAGVSIGSVYKYARIIGLISSFLVNQFTPPLKEDDNMPIELAPYKELLFGQFKQKVYNASKIYQILLTAGFTGSYTLVNNFVRKRELNHNPQKIRIYQSVETGPGEQAQVDWGYFGKIEIDGDVFTLYAFVYVLSYSRVMFAKFVTSQKQRTFQECHIEAFEKMGVPKKIRYDNIKTVIISRRRDEGIIYNFDFQNFANYYHFQPEICPPYYPQSKGKVEASVKYLRNNFWKGERFKKTFHSIQELNNKLALWLHHHANNRIHGTTKEKPLARWEKEKEHLFFLDTLPRYQNYQLSSRRASQNSMVTYKRSAYWVPQEYARKKIDIKEVDNGGVIKLQFQFRGKKIIEHPFASKIGSWVLPKEGNVLLGSTPEKQQERKRRKELRSIEVQQRSLEYYNQFIP